MTGEEWSIVWLSFRVALLALAICLPIAIGVGHLLAKTAFSGKALLSAVVHLPLLLPPVVTGFVLLLAFGKNGWIGAPLYNWLGLTFAFRWTGAALAAALMTLPVVIQPIRIAFESVPREIEEAAMTLGASRWQTWMKVTLPLAMPGVLAGAVLGFVKALGEFGATITFVSNIPGETQTLALAIYALLQTPNGDAAALRLILISIALAFGAVFAADAVSRRLKKHLTS